MEDNYVHHCGHGLWGGPELRRLHPPQHDRGHHENRHGVGRGARHDRRRERGPAVPPEPLQDRRLGRRRHHLQWRRSGWCCATTSLPTVADICAVWPDCGGAGIMLYGNTIYNMRRRLLHRGGRVRHRPAMEHRLRQRRRHRFPRELRQHRLRELPVPQPRRAWASAPATRTTAPRPTR